MATLKPKSQIINGQRALPKTQIVKGERVPVNQPQPAPLQTPPTMAQNASPQVVNTPINQIPMSALTQPSTPVQVPTPTQATQPSAFVQNLQPAIQQGQQNLITAQTKEAEQRNNLLNRLMERDVAPTQDTYTSAFNEQITKMTGKRPEEFLQSLTDANTRLATLQGKFRTAGQAVSSAQGQSKVFEGVQLGELDRQSAVEVGNQALLVQALQGNFDTARQIALDTANFATEDRKMELNNLLAQYDAISGIVEGQEAQLLQQERDRVEAEKAKLERTQQAVDAAIMSGGATVQDMQKLTSTTISDDEKLAIAQSIVGRTAGEDRQLTIENQRLQNYGARLSNQLKKLELSADSGSVGNISNQVNTLFAQEGANTPGITKAVIAELLGSKSISTGTKGRVAPAVEVLNTLDDLASSNIEGKFIGAGLFGRAKEGVKGFFNAKSPEATQNAQKINAINLKVQQWASGASLTEQQTDQVNKLTPTINDSDKEIREKTTELYNFMVNQVEGNLLTEGVNVSFPTVNLFEIRDLYNKATPEQREQLKEIYPQLQ